MSVRRSLILRWLLALLLPLLLMEGLRLAAGSSFSAHGLGLRVGFVLLAYSAALVLNRSAQRSFLALAGWVLALLLIWPAAPWLPPGGFFLTVSAGLWLAGIIALPLSRPSTWRVFASFSKQPAASTNRIKIFPLVINSLISACAALLVSYSLGRVTRFSEEEFFMGLQIAGLGVVSLTLYLACWWADRPAPSLARQAPADPGATRRPGLIVLGVAVLLLLVIPLTLARAYQHSFYSPTASVYPGISSESPFECQVLPPDSQIGYAGLTVFERMLDRVEANPYAAAPEFGMLALGRQDLDWANRYRASLLAEAALGRFTGPANSVKYGQYEASRRIYYYPHLREAFPGLFSDEDQLVLTEWFAAINRRAMTAEWVDWMYGLAFNQWLEGPYENQESGAGLLALLEAYDLADPALSQQNQAYLDREPRGWQARFRNTDDALIYQPEWIYNALFQSQYEQAQPSDARLRRSFEWLTAQSRPGGAPVGYNHVAPVSLGGIAYLGAVLLDDPEMLWIAGQALDYLASNGGWLAAIPGAENPVDFPARSPQIGSCLIYGDSGLPNKVGPLAADKIVLRTGWEPSDPYLLLNLRFSGWHRYKATGAVIYVDDRGPLAVERLSGEQTTWLPSGRSLFRDKRIPRENLNALLIPQSGLAAVIQAITSVGSAWAQDPPFYAQVEKFNANESYSMAEVVTADWNGWQHKRRVYLDALGPVVVYDHAFGPESEIPAIAWYVVTSELHGGSLPTSSQSIHRLQLRQAAELGGEAEILLIPFEAGQLRFAPSGEGILAVQYLPQHGGEVELLTVFLSGEWVGSDAKLLQGGTMLLIDNGNLGIEISLQH